MGVPPFTGKGGCRAPYHFIASHRLRHIALGFVVLLGILAVLTGLLGGDVVSKIIKAGAAGLM